MKISTILDHIDNGHMALPEFQRGYVWNRDQVRGLFDSLYRRHPAFPRLSRSPQGAARRRAEPVHGIATAWRSALARRHGNTGDHDGPSRRRNQQCRGRSGTGGTERMDDVCRATARRHGL
ncbi:DUF262 domain-containing protein [Allochromatium tepidum]|uniref:GmrSD restriction endonuclease domain-containing protein n=1 Tax=Allochromatium tepidum TaxID=553982 RepID=UPI001BCB8E4E